MTPINIEYLKLKEINISISAVTDELTAMMFTAKLYYLGELIGYVTSSDPNNTTFELFENGEKYHDALAHWEGEEYTVEIVKKEGVKVSGEYHTEKEDIYRWIEGQVADWVKDQFY